MNINSKLKMAVTSLLTAVTCCITLCACDGAIYDGEGDCATHYKVRFLDNYNMKYADAFAHEVSTITLYLLDSDGTVVWHNTESGAALAEEGYAMDVDIAPGTYSLLAWGGTSDYGSFTFGSSASKTELTCTLNRQYDDNGNAYVDTDLDGLYHGYVSDVTFSDYPGSYTYSVPLVKNTNSIKVTLQQMSGDMPDASKFTFSITDSNGRMDWDNSLLPDENITYYAWHVEKGEADMDWSFDNSDLEAVKGITRGSEYDNGNGTAAALNAPTRGIAYPAALAEMTTCRLMKGQNTRLTVTNSETGETVFSIPLVEYALMVKDFYNANMDDQEFLDRQDDYDFVFFLDEGYRWMNTCIYINSWRIVLQSADL